MYTITTTSRHLSFSHGDPKRDSRTAHRSCSQSAPSAGEGAASPLLSSCVMFGMSWAAHARARPRSMSRHDWPRRARMSVLIHQVARRAHCAVAWPGREASTGPALGPWGQSSPCRLAAHGRLYFGGRRVENSTGKGTRWQLSSLDRCACGSPGGRRWRILIA